MSMSFQSRQEYLNVMRKRYRQVSSREEKSRLIDEAVDTLGYHRKSLIRELNRSVSRKTIKQKRVKPLKYQAALPAIELVWEALDYPCAERLHPVLATTALMINVSSIRFKFGRWTDFAKLPGPIIPTRIRPLGGWGDTATMLRDDRFRSWSPSGLESKAAIVLLPFKSLYAFSASAIGWMVPKRVRKSTSPSATSRRYSAIFRFSVHRTYAKG